MIYGSVCSGIEAASAAWHPLGWKAAFFSEIEKFPCSVLDHHYPTVPNLGDMTKFKEWPDAIINVLVGGTPCQSFSIAGLRKGLDDPRGNLMLTYLAIAARYRPRFLVWENVPGVLSSNGGRDFGTFLGGLGQLGYGFAYRVLDAQHFGVPQRRRRVFVVGCLGDWRRAAAVLFERHSLSGNPAPSREKGKGFAHDTAPCLTSSGRGVERSGDTRGQDPVIAVAGPLTTRPYADNASQEYNLIAHSLRGEGFDASKDGTGRGTPLVPVAIQNATRGKSQNGLGIGGDVMFTLDQGSQHAIAFDCKASGQNGFGVGNVASTLRSMGHANSHQNGGGHQAVCFAQNTRDEVREMAVVGALAAQPGMKQTSYIRQSMQVRRLTPRECARLQGFPDDYLDILHNGKPAADGPKYKALGNSMAVPCMAWIGERIAMVNRIEA
ncbi:DNA (cytosine-5)-methyltransferase 1 [Nitrosospira sp. Nsp11]|uniref:DNA (cytosine-5-)-methyltransferase n=1 Tax=Nitrosospira sp. Nsp11 TaxID=1855338 RepID=UPI0009105BBD|nr:DNA cytosine methyltransferase [Nitrosospira sp. Nsp11]SHL41963.1 DNA (cytosine-5)-methyltransferase 1 [Nitrosospira sp. Nsp11]